MTEFPFNSCGDWYTGTNYLCALFLSISIAGFKAPHYKQREVRGAKDRHRGAHHVGGVSSIQGTPQRHLGRLPVQFKQHSPPSSIPRALLILGRDTRATPDGRRGDPAGP
jgi:hypothetical protein